MVIEKLGNAKIEAVTGMAAPGWPGVQVRMETAHRSSSRAHGGHLWCAEGTRRGTWRVSDMGTPRKRRVSQRMTAIGVILTPDGEPI